MIEAMAIRQQWMMEARAIINDRSKGDMNDRSKGHSKSHFRSHESELATNEHK